MKLFLATSSGVLDKPGICKLNDCLNRDIDGDNVVKGLNDFVSNHTDFSESNPLIYFDENFDQINKLENAKIVFIHDKINDSVLVNLLIDNSDKLVYHDFTNSELINKFSSENLKESHHMQVNNSIYRQIILKLFSHE